MTKVEIIGVEFEADCLAILKVVWFAKFIPIHSKLGYEIVIIQQRGLNIVVEFKL